MLLLIAISLTIEYIVSIFRFEIIKRKTSLLKIISDKKLVMLIIPVEHTRGQNDF